MARVLDGSGDYFERSVALVTSTPLSMSAWIKTRSLAASQIIMCLCSSSSDNPFYRIYVVLTTGAVIASHRNNAATEGSSTASDAVVVDRWYHVCGVFSGSASRTVYLDGVAGPTNTTSVTTTTVDKTSVGRLGRPSATQYFNGLIDEPCLWRSALSGQDVAALANGNPPESVSPEDIVSFWPFDRKVGGISEYDYGPWGTRNKMPELGSPSTSFDRPPRLLLRPRPVTYFIGGDGYVAPTGVVPMRTLMGVGL